jgi:hypothetical protein
VKERKNLEGLSVERGIMERDIKELKGQGMGGIHLADDRVQWRDLVKSLINFGLRKMLRLSCAESNC